MKKLSKHEIEFLIKILQDGEEIPSDYKYTLFPTLQKEYELVYEGKMRKEDLLANEDGVFPVPLQLEKVFNGSDHEVFKDGWKNMIVFGDNLQFLKTIYENKDGLIKDRVKGKVKLIYIDPPFATADEFQNKEGAKAYNDKKKGAEFVEFLRRRLILAREILADDGSIYVHLDQKMSHYIKILMDEIFGKNYFVNEIVWHYKSFHGQTKSYFPRKHDTIFFYTKSSDRYFDLPRKNIPIKDLIDYKNWGKYIVNENEIRGNYYPRDVRFKRNLDKWEKNNPGKKPTKDDVLYVFQGQPEDDVWDINYIDPKDKQEKTGYPTQKPEALIERIITASSVENDIVMDFFGGSGVAAAVAEKMGRRWITCDLGKLSFFTMQKQILQIEDSKDISSEKKRYGHKAKSFVTARLGSYDLKDALALEWQKYQEFVASLFEVEVKQNKIAGFEFDGEKGGFPVKIFDYRTFKDSTINEDYLKEIHAVIGKKLSGRVYVIAPANYVDFLSNYHEIDGVKYYFLKIPYHVIKELHQKPFQKSRQPRSKKNVNDLDDAVGFHFIRHPEVKSEIKKDKDEVRILIKSFVSQELESDKGQDEKGAKKFETLSAVFVDKSYNGKAFEMDEVFFADEFLPKKTAKKDASEEDIKAELKKIEKTGLEISFKKSELGKQIMVVYTDVYGNDFTEIFTV